MNAARAHLAALDPANRALPAPAAVDEASGLPAFSWMERVEAEATLARRGSAETDVRDEALARARRMDPAPRCWMEQRRALHRHLRTFPVLPMSAPTVVVRRCTRARCFRFATTAWPPWAAGCVRAGPHRRQGLDRRQSSSGAVRRHRHRCCRTAAPVSFPGTYSHPSSRCLIRFRPRPLPRSPGSPAPLWVRSGFRGSGSRRCARSRAGGPGAAPVAGAAQPRDHRLAPPRCLVSASGGRAPARRLRHVSGATLCRDPHARRRL